MGKLGAIIAGVVFGYVDNREIFYISAAFGIFGAVLTWLWLPNTTGLDLEEYDEMQKHIEAETFDQVPGSPFTHSHATQVCLLALPLHTCNTGVPPCCPFTHTRHFTPMH